MVHFTNPEESERRVGRKAAHRHPFFSIYHTPSFLNCTLPMLQACRQARRPGKRKPKNIYFALERRAAKSPGCRQTVINLAGCRVNSGQFSQAASRPGKLKAGCWFRGERTRKDWTRTFMERTHTPALDAPSDANPRPRPFEEKDGLRFTNHETSLRAGGNT